ncbi:MAG: glycosyltransferase family 4 protein, partial [Burkholderiaceae bacterium]|nr:glycosyltransferase family 4 protein [Burkholderiaceae bacterium]
FIRDDELPGFFGRAHAVVLPYTDGTQSGVAAMALGYGRAVVSTRVGSVQEMVRDGDNGILVPPCDAKALTEALRRIVKEPALAQAMGERSYALGQRELSWARNAEISSQAYSQAIAKRGRA